LRWNSYQRTECSKGAGVNLLQNVRISATFGTDHPNDLAARGQLATVVRDFYAQQPVAWYKGVYEVQLMSGPAVGETRLVTISEISVA